MTPLIPLAVLACLANPAHGPDRVPSRCAITPAAAAPMAAMVHPVANHAPRGVFENRVSITGASAVIDLDGALILIDPVGPQAYYRRFGRPDIVILTRADPAHLSVETMIGLLRRDTVVLAPQDVIDRLPLMIANNVITPFEVGMTQTVGRLTFRALAPSDSPAAGTEVYPRDRGDMGMVIDAGGDSAAF